MELAHVVEVLVFSPNDAEASLASLASLTPAQVMRFDHVLAEAMARFTTSSLLHGRVKRIYKQFFQRTDLEAHQCRACGSGVIDRYRGRHGDLQDSRRHVGCGRVGWR